ncbi:RHS repeat-associated core domain-containing protein [Opitutus sp. ER46]|uniref:RHS repeat-associated core domain-containing protein n=1 Tax=Opitutus sp. ER46 TaxID=2161864 RepID=UPI000D311BD2|nr:RHS repeat-associated core domain-containing protein [Opitutus sp. ER46]PTY01138.1 hypothetical protein DB354_00405 [Opitutus sp. ER46]
MNGTVDQAAKVLVDGILAGRQQTYWAGEAFLDNANGPAYDANVQIKAVKPGATDTKQTTTVAAFLPPATETLTYDEDGNLKSDGRWAYTWDAENRLVEMKTTDAAAAAGLPARRLEFRYDSLGRRIGKVVSTKSGTTWTAIQDLRFVYQGWNLIAEVNASDALQRTYVWGLDLASSLNATGGIGALVQMVDHTGTATAYLPAYDGGGNVAALMSSDGSPAAVYEYGPFGERMRAEGTYATTNPFRHATKFTDEESGLVYYGRRYYSPSLGRFISRDPIGAAGGPNLYGFVANDPINQTDILGMGSEDEITKLKPFEVKAKRPPETGGIIGFSLGDMYDYDFGSPGIIVVGPIGDISGNAPNKPDCATLKAQLAAAQNTQAKYDRRFGQGGEYSGFGGLLDAIDPVDLTSVTSALSSLGAGARADYLLKTVERTGRSLQGEMTYYPNRAAKWSTIGKVATVVGAGADGWALGNDISQGQWSNVPLDAGNIAADFYSFAAFTPGVGLGVAIGQAGINASLAAYKFSAAKQDLGNTFLSAARAKVTQRAATAKVAELESEMAANGCK